MVATMKNQLSPVTEPQQLVARIKRSSKYFHQRPNGEWFAVRLSRRYPVVSGNNNAYELSDVVFGVRLDDGSVMELKP